MNFGFRLSILALSISIALIGVSTYKNHQESIRNHEQMRNDLVRLDTRLLQAEVDIKNLESHPQGHNAEAYLVTAYCKCEICTGKNDGVTKSGIKAEEGVTMAADESAPFGTVFYIEGLGYRTVQDRGGDIKGKRIDVYFDDHKEALKFGKKWLAVERMD